MRFKNLIFTEKDAEKFGLEQFKSSRFGNVLALVGKNGSGKTRFLKALETKIKNIDFRDINRSTYEFIPTIITTNAQLVSHLFEIVTLQEELAQLQQGSEIYQKPNEIVQKIEDIQFQINKINLKTPLNTKTRRQIEQINNLIRKETKKRLKVIKPSDFRALHASIDKTIDQNITFQNIIDSSQENIEVDEFSMINQSALTYLQRLPHKLALDDIETRGDEKKFKKRVAYKRYKLLRSLLQEFLGKNLEWKSRSSNIDEHDDHVSIKATGYWTLDSRGFDYNEFSDGEKVLFTYALLLFLLNTNPRVKFSESIIIIDEPELNLHPKAQIKLIQSIQELIKDHGQLIIATHSLSIIANLDYGSIFLVRNNKIHTPSSSVPFDSIDDLMGFDEHYNKIVEFLISTPSWAMTNFMGQCFDDPKVFELATKNDPQIELFKKLVQNSQNLSILDFGSGKGRLLERVKESETTWSRIQIYDCFDINSKFNELVKLKGAKSVFNDIKDLEDNKYDIVVLVNVLHEIHIKDWSLSINKIKKSLKTNGFITIIEDTKLPIGELPNEHGFLILGKSEMQTLFGSEVKFFHPNSERYKDRIVCGFIHSDKIKRIDKNILIKTLNKLKTNSLKDIIEYRQMEKNHDLGMGRLFGLKSNLYVNSELAIEYLENTK